METSPPASPSPARSPARAARPRLFIKEMVLHGFKSYAGEQRIGPFHKSFSAVVGPNGSGKSNVIDAMLFVFGKRAKQEMQTHHLRKLQESKIPEGVPRLFDLVKVEDEKLKFSFFAILGNTVIANDLDQATRIAYCAANEFSRVVTLDGALFEKSGTMSGGGSKRRGGKMGTSVRESVSEKAVVNAENDLNKLVDQLNRLRENINDAYRLRIYQPNVTQEASQCTDATHC